MFRNNTNRRRSQSYRKRRPGKNRNRSQRGGAGATWSIIISVLIIFIVVGWVGSRYLNHGTVMQERIPGQSALAPGTGIKSANNNKNHIVVKVIKSVAKLHNIKFSFAGTLDAYTRTILVSTVNSQVSKIYGNVGDYFRQGDPIIEFDVNEKRSQYLQASSALNRARLNYNAAQTLFSKNLYSYNQLLQAEEVLHQAQTAFKMTQLNLKHTIIAAPYDGMLEKRSIDVGTPVAIGTMIGSFIQTSPLQAKIFVSEKEMKYVALRKLAIIISSSGQIRKGNIISISSSADPVTHTFEVDVIFKNPKYRFRIGEAVTVMVESNNQYAHFIPPSALVLNEQGLLGVIVLNHGKANFHQISVQEETDRGVWILGLPRRATIVIQGQGYLKSGMNVQSTMHSITSMSNLRKFTSTIKNNPMVKSGITKIKRAMNRKKPKNRKNSTRNSVKISVTQVHRSQ